MACSALQSDGTHNINKVSMLSDRFFFFMSYTLEWKIAGFFSVLSVRLVVHMVWICVGGEQKDGWHTEKRKYSKEIKTLWKMMIQIHTHTHVLTMEKEK